MHEATFEYLKPTDAQVDDMGMCRKAAHEYASTVEMLVPEGPDKTYLLRKFREVAMWVNIAITRHADGAPRDTQADDELREDRFIRQSGEVHEPPLGGELGSKVE